MASSQQVQDYLQKHKIGNLFEDLMAMVVSDMPEDPVLYMLQALERKATRMGTKSLMRKSMGDLGGVAVAKDRPYTKPWQTNTKRQTKKKLSETDPTARRPKTAGERPGWDGTVKGAETNLDDFWAEGGGTEKPAKGRAGSPVRRQQRPSQAWADDTEDEELLYRSQGGYAGPRRSCDTDSDPLSGEFGLERVRPTPAEHRAVVTSSGRVRGPAVDAQKHRQKLARLINDSQKQVDSGYEDDKDLEEDDALELLEDADELMSEGVKIPKGPGIRFNPMRQSVLGAKPQVRVSICARCARVMDGAAPSEPAQGLGYGELPDFDVDTDQEFAPESRPQSSARYTDDEFESVSQVSGPRQPVWQTADSDNEALGARKGHHMFTSSGVPSKGRPMFSPEPDDVPKSSLRATTGGYQSLDTGATARRLKGHSAFNRTWTEGIGFTDDEEDDGPVEKGVTFREDDAATTSRDATSKHQSDDEDGTGESVSLQGAGWSMPTTDYDSDFTEPPARVTRVRGKARPYQGQY